MTDLPRFHLAIPVDDLVAAAAFYGGVLGCEQGRSAERWIDWNFAGHQVVTHVVPPAVGGAAVGGAAVGGAAVGGAAVGGAAVGGAAVGGAAVGGGRVEGHNPVDGHDVPVPHFGLILAIPAFHEMADRLRAAETAFVIAPYLRFAGEVGEQWTMFFYDPAGNAIEVKAFADDAQVFAR